MSDEVEVQLDLELTSQGVWPGLTLKNGVKLIESGELGAVWTARGVTTDGGDPVAALRINLGGGRVAMVEISVRALQKVAAILGARYPRREHQFESSWQPHPEKRGDEQDRIEATCTVCGLTIINPTDAHVIDYFPPVEALTREWLGMMGYPDECAGPPKKPYAPPTLRKLDPEEVMRKLAARGSEEANRVPGGGEHEREEGAREREAPELGDLAVTREPVDECTNNGDEHGK